MPTFKDARKVFGNTLAGLLYWWDLLFLHVFLSALRNWLWFFGLAIIPNGVAVLLYLRNNSWDWSKLWQEVGELGMYLLEASLWTAGIFLLYFLLSIPAARHKDLLARANKLTWEDMEITKYKRGKFDVFGDGFIIKSGKPFELHNVSVYLIEIQQERKRILEKPHRLGWINKKKGNTVFTSFEMNNGEEKYISLVDYGNGVIDEKANALFLNETDDKLYIWNNTDYIATIRIKGTIEGNEILPHKTIRIHVNYDGTEMSLNILEDDEND